MRVSSISIGRLLTRRWMLLVVVVVVAVAGSCVYRLYGIFGSHNTTSTAGGFSNETAPFDAKHVVLRLSGRRIIIDGAVKDERSVKTLNAYTFCLDQSG